MINVFYKKNLFFLDTDNFDYFADLKKLGFAWYKYENTKLWCTPFYSLVEIIKNKSAQIHLEASAIEAILKLKERVYKSSHNGNGLKHEYLFPFQVSGVDFIVESIKNNKAVLIADAMGLGKTVEAIEFCNKAEIKSEDIIVVCPASLKTNWANEWHRFAKDKKKPYIINYERLIKDKEAQTKKWEVAIVDEVHYCKNPEAQRTKAVVGGGKERNKGLNADYKIAITGTPILNRPIELYPILHWLLPHGFTNKMTYAKRYCNPKFNGYTWDMTGHSNLDELQKRLRSTVMLRRLKEDVLTHLPAKRRQIIELEPTDNMSAILGIEQRNFGDAIKSQQLTELQFRDTVKKLSILSGMPGFEEIAKYRHDLGVLKVPLIIEHLEKCLEEEKKIVFFAHHQDVLGDVHRHFLKNSVLLTGRTPVNKRQEIVDRFQKDKSITLFCGNIKAAGVGYTLTAAKLAVFGELDFVPGNISQAEDRIHRIGQTGKALIQHLVVAGTLEAVMSKIIVRKTEIIEKAMDQVIDPEIKEFLV